MKEVLKVEHGGDYGGKLRRLSSGYRKDIPPVPLDLEGKKVVIKPNVLRRATPEEGVTTHPSVLKAVVNEVVKWINTRL